MTTHFCHQPQPIPSEADMEVGEGLKTRWRCEFSEYASQMMLKMIGYFEDKVCMPPTVW
jgi:hypothetical protein